MRIKLTDKNLPTIETAFAKGGKSDMIAFDTDIKRFGYRLRRGGHRSWIVQYEDRGTKRISLGNAKIITPDQARHLAKQELAKVELGADPAAQRVQEKAADRLTLGSVIEQYLQARQHPIRPMRPLRPKSLAAINLYLTKTFAPLHRIPISKVTRANVADILVRIAREYPTTASLARSTLMSFYAWAIKKGLCDENPTIHTDDPHPREPRDRVLKDRELALVWNALPDDNYGRIVKLLILTAARREEVGGLRWSELEDPDNPGCWVLPKERAKNKREHVLTLPQIAWDAIGTVKRNEFREHVFGKRGFTKWPDCKKALDKQLDIKPWVIHDLRRSVATGMANIGIQPHIIETILNHVSGHKGGVAGVYNRSPYAREVKVALELWADHIRSIVTDTQRKVIR